MTAAFILQTTYKFTTFRIEALTLPNAP